MSDNPFADIHQIPSNGQVPSGQAIAFPGTIQVPILRAPPAMPDNGVAVPSSQYDAGEVSFSPPLRWSAADLSKSPKLPPHPYIQYLTISDYLLGAIFPDQTIGSAILLELRNETPNSPSSPVRLGLFLRTPPQQRPVSAPAAAPNDTGRLVSKVLITEATGATEQAARKALVKAIVAMGVSLTHVTTQHLVLSHLYRQPDFALQSIKRGIQGMAAVSEAEWVERMVQLRPVKKDGMPWFEARLEVLLLEGGFSGLAKWASIVDVALGLREEQRVEWSKTYGEVVRFLDIVQTDLYMVEE